MSHELKFVNADATPKTEIIHVDAEALPRVMEWYGAFHAGDWYDVFIDGLKVAKDQNGALIGGVE
tara:strand:+ start:2142 stop:2336 length:195 start_codon:yes stop_codon:yes gene_type:complete